MKKIVGITLLLTFYLTFPDVTYAHAFGAVYTLPIPFWLYLYGGAGALLISFLLIGFLYTHKNTYQLPSYTVSKLYSVRLLTSRLAVTLYKILSVFLLILCILTGFFGENLSAFNFSMPFFWIVFVVGFTYLTFVLGNVWSIVNPWKVLLQAFEKLTHKPISRTLVYPTHLGYLPALLIYMLFIGIELFGGTTPFSLAIILLQYTVITFLGASLYGVKDWFTYGEFFSVFFRLISYCSAIYCEKRTVVVSLPFAQILKLRAEHLTLVFFVLFMLSSTAYDGMRETNIWYLGYWDVFSGLLGPEGFHLYEVVGLIISPFIFFLLYYVCMYLMKLVTRTTRSTNMLVLDFIFALLPIALVYNIAHYFSLLLLQGPLVYRLISDPFGYGWNLFGTASFIPDQTLLSAAFLWHFQVAVILLGHILSVVLSHGIALRLFKTQKLVLLSQLPMLLLMVLYTVIGLWILSQPIGITS